MKLIKPVLFCLFTSEFVPFPLEIETSAQEIMEVAKNLETKMEKFKV
ncbi:hypothetical protein [Caldicellulosiruptor morganii]|uniref:Uncharacterized protein n=1 Tax=Caldicellulosiruptor morganii TaxID=1387555 RepID=A0ABY7BM01_9FIRM|nr:hypothetical protein [Caldicellulosiruptor morganii]WAM33873.1 hypothetical protein OTK00_000010 [Caldicellulosiruptor morganii]